MGNKSTKKAVQSTEGAQGADSKSSIPVNEVPSVLSIERNSMAIHQMGAVSAAAATSGGAAAPLDPAVQQLIAQSQFTFRKEVEKLNDALGKQLQLLQRRQEQLAAVIKEQRMLQDLYETLRAKRKQLPFWAIFQKLYLRATRASIIREFKMLEKQKMNLKGLASVNEAIFWTLMDKCEELKEIAPFGLRINADAAESFMAALTSA